MALEPVAPGLPAPSEEALQRMRFRKALARKAAGDVQDLEAQAS